MIAVFGVVALVVALANSSRTITGQAEPRTAASSDAPASGSSAPTSRGSGAVPQDGWTTLRNPTAGLSYQIPPTGWTTQTSDGTAGPVTLTQGGRRTAYTCGTPAQEYLRGQLGSGVTPPATPAQVANALAYTAASEYYTTGTTPPQVAVGAVEQITRTTPNGSTVSGVVVGAIATQSKDPCLASKGEVLVLVIALSNQDAVLMVNGDLSGGPATPAPATDAELRTIVATAIPISN